MSRDDEKQWLAREVAPRLESVWRARASAVPGAPLDATTRRRCRAALRELYTFLYEPGHRANHYTCRGLPRTHNGWEMQLLVDGGLLFFLYTSCRTIVEDSADAEELRDRVEELCARLDTSRPAVLLDELGRHYAEAIAPFLRRPRRASHELVEAYLERVVIEAYLRLAMTSPAAILTFDLFPAHTGPENVREGLRGLVTLSPTRASRRKARRFYCCRAESYTRYYGLNVARELARARAGSGGSGDSGAPLRFSLVVPHANGVRNITLTRCWPVDGAENAARYTALVRQVWSEHEGALGPRSHGAAPRILVSGYSQGGAAVRILDDAICGVDVLARPHFRDGAPRGYRSRCVTLARVSAGEWRAQPGPELYTLSVATMGGIDGRALSERCPELPELGEDQRGAAGVRARANPHGGLHLAICHDYDPARWIVPAPLINVARRSRPRKLSLVRTLLRFGGPNLVFHGGTWSADTQAVFRDNAAARALLDDVHARLASPVFVDEHRYFDERCEREAFPHLVVGTHGYPGWTVVEYFAAALERRGEVPRPRPGGELAELLHEGSWRYDILPGDQAYHEVVAAAARFHERQRRRGLALLAELEAGQRAVALRDELIELLRRRFAEPGARRHLLR